MTVADAGGSTEVPVLVTHVGVVPMNGVVVSAPEMRSIAPDDLEFEICVTSMAGGEPQCTMIEAAEKEAMKA